jgi:hypothetical protein
MSLRVALVIDGDQAGAKKALDETAAGIGKVETAANKATAPVAKIETGLKDTATAAGEVALEVPKIGTAAETAGGKFDGLKTLALGAIGGIAGSIAAAGLEAALGAIGGAAIAMANDIVSAGPQIKTALEEHATLIKSIKGLYEEAEGAASSYGNNSATQLTFSTQQNIEQLRAARAREMGEVLSGSGIDQGLDFLNPLSAGAGIGFDQGGAILGTAFEEPVRRFREELKAGTADAIAFKEEIAGIGAALPADDQAGRDLASQLLGDVDRLAELDAELQRAIDLYAGLKGNAEATATALGGAAENFTLAGSSAEGANAALERYLQLLQDIAATPAPPAPAAPVGGPFVVGGGFAAGGWTGDMPADRVAGFVHGREYVFDAASTAAIGVENLDAMRRGIRGYAMGGYVGTAGVSVGGASGFSAVDELLDGFQMVSGAVSQFVRDLLQTRDPLQALGSVIGSVIQSISQSFLSSAINGVANFAGNWVSSLFGGGGAQLQLGYQAGVYHQGGDVGSPASSRLVPAALFNNAPRLHQGLAGDEFAAILQEGETVIPRGGRAMMGGGTTINNWNIETPSPRAFMESRASVARAGARLNGQAWRHS